MDAALPFELIERVVELITDRPSLEACSLSASIFRESAQKRLLSAVGPPQASPTISPREPNHTTTPSPASPLFPISAAMDEQSDTLAGIVRLLDSVKNLHLYGDAECEPHVAGPLLGAILDLVSESFQIPLAQLTLFCMDDVAPDTVPKILRASRSLTALYISVRDDHIGNGAIAETPTVAPLDCLSSVASRTLLALFLQPTVIAHFYLLREISVVCQDTAEEKATLALCEVAAATLETVTIAFHYAIPAVFNFPRLLKATTLNLQFIGENLDDATYAPIPGILIPALAATPSLQYLKIGLRAHTSSLRSSSPPANPHKTLAGVDHAAAAHSSLQRLTWDICFVQRHRKPQPNVRPFIAALRNAFPALSAKGLFRLRQTTERDPFSDYVSSERDFAARGAAVKAPA
ncbi:hypothetical protein MKEN_00391700 [Mycena kentingensis (nom. inval.)]|nr:hypothetical protein MKEN_00391700 [Mycena kentingensis (nom. inval.)]